MWKPPKSAGTAEQSGNGPTYREARATSKQGESLAVFGVKP